MEVKCNYYTYRVIFAMVKPNPGPSPCLNPAFSLHICVHGTWYWLL